MNFQIACVMGLAKRIANQYWLKCESFFVAWNLFLTVIMILQVQEKFLESVTNFRSMQPISKFARIGRGEFTDLHMEVELHH
jgi:hypothetical protein